jgi:hypothetical protein
VSTFGGDVGKPRTAQMHIGPRLSPHSYGFRDGTSPEGKVRCFLSKVRFSFSILCQVMVFAAVGRLDMLPRFLGPIADCIMPLPHLGW